MPLIETASPTGPVLGRNPPSLGRWIWAYVASVMVGYLAVMSVIFSVAYPVRFSRISLSFLADALFWILSAIFFTLVSPVFLALLVTCLPVTVIATEMFRRFGIRHPAAFAAAGTLNPFVPVLVLLLWSDKPRKPILPSQFGTMAAIVAILAATGAMAGLVFWFLAIRQPRSIALQDGKA